MAEIETFADAPAWEAWLAQNHATAREIWVPIAKKSSAVRTVTYDEALDASLCYGWIDGQRKTLDADRFVQRFTPRRPKGLWSKRNVGKATELIDAGRMRPSGLAEIEAARRDGRWDAAYDSQRDMRLPEEFLSAVGASEAAQASLDAMSRSERYSMAFRLHRIKTPEARARRIAALVEALERGETPR